MKKIENGTIVRQQATFKIIIKHTKKEGFECQILRYTNLPVLDPRISPEGRRDILSKEGFLGTENAYTLNDIGEAFSEILKKKFDGEKLYIKNITTCIT